MFSNRTRDDICGARLVTALIAITLLAGFGAAELQAFEIATRWSSTATDGGGLGQGDPTTLTWGFVDDGTFIARSGGASGNSNLIAFLDGLYGSGAGPAGDLTQRPWFSFFQDNYDRLESLSALTFVYEPNDSGAAIDATTSPSGSLGTVADLRIGGYSIDGQTGSNVVAYNYYPDHGDMAFDTDNSNFYGNTFENSRALRNTHMHETGHGLGLGHVASSTENFRMEQGNAFILDGPQLDDILGLQRSYGDAYEKNAGNDTAANVLSLGNFASTPGSVTLGTQGDSTTVDLLDTDFVSIDDDSDLDFFSFTVGSFAEADITLTPKGATYMVGPSGGTEASFNASALGDLMLALLDTDGSSVLASANASGLGGIESILDFALPDAGEYFIRVTSATNNVQLYQLALDVTTIPEPGTIALAMLGVGVLVLRRGRGA